MSTIVKEPKKSSSTYTTEDRGIIQISNSELPKNLVLKLYIYFFKITVGTWYKDTSHPKEYIMWTLGKTFTIHTD